MRGGDGAHAINVCSPAGRMGAPLLAVYAASKAAVSGWTRSLQAEWADSEIHVSEYVPGPIETELGSAAAAAPELARRSGDLLDDPPRSRLARRLAAPPPAAPKPSARSSWGFCTARGPSPARAAASASCWRWHNRPRCGA